MSGSRRLGTLQVRSEHEAIEVAVLDGSFAVVAKGTGEVDAQLPPGLYELHVRVGPAEERRLFKLEPGVEHVERVHLADPNAPDDATAVRLAVPSAAPVGGTSTTREEHMHFAHVASSALMDTRTSSGLVVMVRVPRGSTARLRRPLIHRVSVLDAQSQPVPLAWEHGPSWATSFLPLAPGGYALRVDRPRSEGGPTLQSLWVAEYWQTLVFIAVTDEGLAPERAAVHMTQITDPWDPQTDRRDIDLAAEAARWSLREGRPEIPPRLLDFLLRTKFRNPMLGIFGAHVLLLNPAPDLDLLSVVIGNLSGLVQGHPDVRALEWLLEDARRERRALGDDGARVSWPPMLAASYAAAVRRDAYDPGAIVEGSPAEELVPHLVTTGIWTTWGEQRRSRSRARTLELSVDDAEDAASKRVAGYVETLARRSDESRASVLASLDERQCALGTGLPTAVARRALTRLRSAEDDASTRSNGVIIDPTIELPRRRRASSRARSAAEYPTATRTTRRRREAVMERHGSETYWVEGEGVLGEVMEGRPRTLAAALEQAVPPFRFSRMGPKGLNKQLGEPNRLKVAQAMTADSLTDGQMPAGFTYLGQFIDHDLTFDKTGLMEGVDISPLDIEQSRSPSLDLDSLYAAGPQDSGSAKFYSDGLHLKVGNASGGAPSQGFDLPRVGSGPKPREALIPDPRNDENLAVAQLHLALIRFHNRVVDTLPAAMPPAQKFTTARKIVTKHYQWMIRTDYLPRICAPSVVTNVFSQGRKAFEVGAVPTSMPTMPLEFSVAAFRLGHSMIRAQYSWNKVFPAATLGQLFEFAALGGDLGGANTLPNIWIADWRRLFNFGSSGINRPDLVVPAGAFNKAMRIDTKLVNPLRVLPVVSDPAPRNNLAFRNLLRANMVKLATGQQMVAFLKSKGVQVTKLTNTEIRDGSDGADLSALTQSQRTKLLQDTPLWFYLLREAELNSGKLKGVGARIVAETFHRAMQGSKFSIVRDKNFRPSLGPDNSTFRMVDLLLFAFEGNAALLNPLGD